MIEKLKWAWAVMHFINEGPDLNTRLQYKEKEKRKNEWPLEVEVSNIPDVWVRVSCGDIYK